MDSDGRLIERIGKRDEAAFAALVSRYGGRLLAVASRLLGSRADAEDAVQRALLQCFASASSYQEEWAAVSTWLYRILSNVCVDELRRRSARASRDLKITGTPGPRDRQPGAYLDLHRALDRVPREARVLLALHYVDGLSYDELARIRGISINTVKSQLSRGKSLLRAELARRGASR